MNKIFIFIQCLMIGMMYADRKDNVKRKDRLNFIIVGDHGSGNEHQKIIAQGLINYVKSLPEKKIDFIISTGDVIYPNGLHMTKPDRRPIQLKERFESIYSDQSLQVPWLITLGNHDCQGSIPAYLEYANNENSLWYFPSRYYYEKVKISSDSILYIIVLDTCDLVCGDLTPEDFDNYREGKTKKAIDPRCFENKNNIVSQTTPQTKRKQLIWLEKLLRNINLEAKNSKEKQIWKIVVGHWSIFSHLGNYETPELIRTVQPLLVKYKVHAYLNGHDHVLQHIYHNNNEQWQPHYIVSGAGGFNLAYEYTKEEIKYLDKGCDNLIHYYLPMGFMTATIQSKNDQNENNEFKVDLRNSNGSVIDSFTIDYFGNNSRAFESEIGDALANGINLNNRQYDLIKKDSKSKRKKTKTKSK